VGVSLAIPGPSNVVVYAMPALGQQRIVDELHRVSKAHDSFDGDSVRDFDPLLFAARIVCRMSPQKT
jgi:hypothetical protein